MDITLIKTLIIGIGTIATTLLALHKIWTSIVEPYCKKKRDKKTNLDNAILHIETMSQKLDQVSKELQPNGGGSIKDQVKQIANDVKVMRVERDATFHLSKEPMFKTDAQGHCTSANYAACSIFGITQNEMMGLGWFNHVLESEKERVRDEWENIIKSGNELATQFIIVNPVDYSHVPVKYKGVVNRDNDGHIISIIGSIEKVNKRLNKNLNVA